MVYGTAGLVDNKLESLHTKLDLDQEKGHFRQITELKRKFPTLKVILSVGGGADHADENASTKYLELLESSAARVKFINSAYALVKSYNFDGLDLAWQFPADRPVKIKSGLGSLWSGFKNTIGLSKGPIDEKAAEHKEEYTALLRELKNAFRHDGYIVAITVSPHVNSSRKIRLYFSILFISNLLRNLLTVFFDIPAIINNVDYVTLPTYDFQTAARNPKEADHPAPIQELNERQPGHNINAQVQHWLGEHAPASKLIVAIPTFGRTWTLKEGATATGVPPIREIETAGPEGAQSKQAGLLSYPEICAKLPNANNNNLRGEEAPLRKVNDPTKRFGTYAYRLPDGDGNFGLWVGYEDPDTAGNKAAYVRSKGLGGIAVVDLSYDDFRGTCSGDKYPVLRAAKYRLTA